MNITRKIIIFFKQLFCKHSYVKKSNKFRDLGLEICTKCGKEKYSVKDLEYTHFKIKTNLIINNKK